MGTVTHLHQAKFSPGDLVHHRLFDYRGVVVDVDPRCNAPDQWYEAVARSRPPKNLPWYHVLVHGAEHTTYVAQRNLEPDKSGLAVDHPLVGRLFERFEDGRYHRRGPLN